MILIKEFLKNKKQWPTDLNFLYSSEYDKIIKVKEFNFEDEIVLDSKGHVHFFDTLYIQKHKIQKDLKQDKGKLDWHAISFDLLEPLVETLMAGIKKRGYKKFSHLGNIADPNIFWSKVIRHLKSCQLYPLAIDDDPKNGTDCYHAACAAFNCLMYLYHHKENNKSQKHLIPPL